MGTIDATAAEVAETLITEFGAYDEYPDLRAAHVETATLAAVRMSARLGKSIQAEDYYEQAINFQSRVFSQAQSHNQIFVGIGYATLITVWSATASNIPVFAMLISGICLLISASVFVGWTIVGMFVTYTTLMRTLKVYADGPVDFITRNAATEHENSQTLLKVQRCWKPVVAAAGIPALIASITLIAATSEAVASKATAAQRQSQSVKVAPILKVNPVCSVASPPAVVPS